LGGGWMGVRRVVDLLITARFDNYFCQERSETNQRQATAATMMINKLMKDTFGYEQGC
jgi:hypothetical protein